jgi:hypothetical protein
MIYTFNSFVSDTVSLGFILFGCYLFVLVLGESVFVQVFPIGSINFSLVFILLPVNDMDWEEASRKALKLPVENVSTEISKGTISSHPVSRHKNLCYSLSIYFLFLSWEMMTAWLERGTRYTFGVMGPARC